MEDKILAKILETTYTLSSLKKRTKALKSRLSEHFFGGDTNKQMVQEELEWLNSYGEQFLKDFQKESFYQTMAKIEEKINHLKPLTIFLAFQPEEEQLSQIGIKARQVFTSGAILDIKYDPALVGGSAFVWNGVYKDYSIRSRIQSDKEKILSSFKSYLAAKSSN